MIDFVLDALGSRLFVTVETQENLEGVFSSISEEIRFFERKFSRFLPDNWLAELNRNGGWELDWDALEMVRLMLDVHGKTDGYFDPTVGGTLDEMGYGPGSICEVSSSFRETSWFRHSREGGNLVREISGSSPGIANSHVHPKFRLDGNALSLSEKTRLEFWGIGKGYMLEKIARSLARFENYVVNFWGDIYVKWDHLIALEDPLNPEMAVGQIRIEDGFFCASSPMKRRFWNHHHLIDPKSGQSATEVLATFIESSSWAVADMYATALAVMPFEKACETLERVPEIEGVVMDAERRIYRSGGSRIELFLA